MNQRSLHRSLLTKPCQVLFPFLA
ncbi:hypothetical protein NC653_015681 [Populus alba x Populus x berolinensis]|uniref:Uncharacterized protein n=1 Tax=Populus alba x Populus x berolinensis TaxID=444605 RepID=A0AAD6VYQ6_9ROSI|nr:hypothetical protein NC653_015681 [Populus alba x Populus x berolinensis]